MSKLTRFEIHAENPGRAAKFYAELFDWTVKELVMPGVEVVKDENRYWIVSTAPENTPGAISGGILFRKGPSPTGFEPITSFVCTMDVENLDDSVKRAVSLGGKLALPKVPVRGIGWLAYAKDTEGNIFGMMEPDVEAK